MSFIQRMMHLCPPSTRGSSFQSTMGSDTSSSKNLSRYRVCAARGIRPTATDQLEPGQGDSINTIGHSSGGCVYVSSSVRTARAFLIQVGWLITQYRSISAEHLASDSRKQEVVAISSGAC